MKESRRDQTTMLNERMQDFIKHDPRYADLQARLLKLGGRLVVPRTEPDLEILINRGKSWPTRGLRLWVGEPSACHANTADLWEKWHTKGFRIVTGWGLTHNDQLWRQHSWGWLGRIIETTLRRDKYFGTMLTPAESQHFLNGNL